jgi:Fic family protein
MQVVSGPIGRERVHYSAPPAGGLDVTCWMDWILGCLHRAIGGAGNALSAVLSKAHFWQRHTTAQLNGRQIKVLNHLRDGLEGKLTSSKWARIAKCSQDTASRDIVALVEMNILTKGSSGGRTTSYSIASAADS